MSALTHYRADSPTFVKSGAPKCLDDEEHRLNVCPVFSHTNYSNCPTKIEIKELYSENVETVREILARIGTVWNTHTGQGSVVVT